MRINNLVSFSLYIFRQQALKMTFLIYNYIKAAKKGMNNFLLNHDHVVKITFRHKTRILF